MNHLSEDDFTLLLENEIASMPKHLIAHFNMCKSCKAIFDEQRLVHTTLVKIKPQTAPLMLTRKILIKLTAMEKTFKSNVKTDWLFLIAITVLFFVASWYTYFGSNDILTAGYFNEINEYTSQFNRPDLNSILIVPFTWLTDFSVKTIYLFMGIISLAMYWLFDKYLNGSIPTKKS